MAESRFGELPPQHNFALNPHTDYRASSCPKCNGLTKARKFALFIHVNPDHFITLGRTCRYCPKCDLIIAHKDELESLLAQLFSNLDPAVIGNDYLVIGTVEHKAWRQGLKRPNATSPMNEMLPHVADFKRYWTIDFKPGGWYPAEK